MRTVRPLLAAAALALPAAAFAQTACALLTEAEAVALVGGPLGATFKHEEKANATNGHDHNTTCGFYFPKNYNPRKADAPPERAVSLQIHRMRTPADGRQFYEMMSSGAVEMNKARNGGSTFAPVAGVGETAQLEKMKLDADGIDVVHLHFLKGAVAAQVTVWRKKADAAQAAQAAAKQIAAKLP